MGLNAFYWYQIFALESAVVEAQEMLSSHWGFRTIAMYHHRETIRGVIREISGKVILNRIAFIDCNGNSYIERDCHS